MEGLTDLFGVFVSVGMISLCALMLVYALTVMGPDNREDSLYSPMLFLPTKRFYYLLMVTVVLVVTGSVGSFILHSI